MTTRLLAFEKANLLLLTFRRLQAKDLQLLVAGHKDFSIRDHRHEVGVAADILPGPSKTFEELRHVAAGVWVEGEKINSGLR